MIRTMSRKSPDFCCNVQILIFSIGGFFAEDEYGYEFYAFQGKFTYNLKSFWLVYLLKHHMGFSSNSISRHAFLKKIGLGGSSLLAVYCLGWTSNACSSEKVIGSADDFTLDISKGKFKELQQPGGWVKVNNVVIACTSLGQFVAVSSICSHEGENRVEYRPGEKDFRCTAHGAEFNLNGTGKNKKARKGIPVYETSLSEQLLRIRLPKS